MPQQQNLDRTADFRRIFYNLFSAAALFKTYPAYQIVGKFAFSTAPAAAAGNAFVEIRHTCVRRYLKSPFCPTVVFTRFKLVLAGNVSVAFGLRNGFAENAERNERG